MTTLLTIILILVLIVSPLASWLSWRAGYWTGRSDVMSGKPARIA